MVTTLHAQLEYYRSQHRTKGREALPPVWRATDCAFYSNLFLQLAKRSEAVFPWLGLTVRWALYFREEQARFVFRGERSADSMGCLDLRIERLV